jgi:hypothetical protein
MEVAPLPSNEVARLRTLKHYCILETEAEAAFDDLAALAADLCQTEIGVLYTTPQKGIVQNEMHESHDKKDVALFLSYGDD